jgi:hypothetical protein
MSATAHVILRKGPLETAQTFDQSPRLDLLVCVLHWPPCRTGHQPPYEKPHPPSGAAVGGSGAGTVDRPNHHAHASKIAVGYTAS